jgi:hypothetical protein
VADLAFGPNALVEMAADAISEAEVYHVVEDADGIIDREDGRTEYTRMLDDGRWVLVLIEHDDITVVSVWWDKRRSRRRRR